MNAIVDQTLRFFLENLPSLALLLAGGPLGLAWAYGGLYLAGRLKRDAGLRTGYTRKIFHFFTFGTVVVLHALWGSRAVCALLEAVSPHGWDNAVLQVAPSFLAVVCLKGGVA